jgi:hypothetical protein
MIKLFFFGTLPLGWKRFFRAISFVWVLFCVILQYEDLFNFSTDDTWLLWLILLSPLILSYAISGFFGKKTD